MEKSCFCDSYIVKRGIRNIILGSNKKDIHDDSKEMSAEEAAVVFADFEIEMLKKDYECLSSTPQQIVEKICQEVLGQEEAIQKLVHVVYYNQMSNFLEDIGESAPKRINVLLVGPTGCGKTSSINALKKYFEVPVAKYNADAITSAGYIGQKVEDILIRLFEESKRNLALAERGVIFIDEFDKKAEQITSAGKDINGKAVQEELLKILEPNTIDLKLHDNTKIQFYTGRLTVILGGAFVGLDDIRKKRLCKTALGFGRTNEMSEEEVQKHKFIPQDFIKYGFIPELVGRIVMIDEFRKLELDDIMRIMLNGKNSPYREKTNFITNALNVELQISMKFLKRIAEETLDTGTGARSLEAKITNIFYPIIQEIFEHKEDYGVCLIDESGAYELIFDDVTYYGEVED